MEEYRGTGHGFVDANGNSAWPGQYQVPCIDDPGYQAYAKRFLAACAKHFGGDARVGGYVLWGEPILFRPGSGAPICYCEHTVAKFRAWLEERYGSITMLWATVITAFVAGIIQFVFFPGQGLLGASGIVFMMIIMASLGGMRSGGIPLTLVLVFLFYIGGEIYNGIALSDNVSQLTHIIGGICGAVLGILIRSRKK